MRSFRRLSIATLASVYILILVGGIVRSTGAGYGLPRLAEMFWKMGSSNFGVPIA
jgi:cytochrome c oxidase assembly protein subunit 15